MNVTCPKPWQKTMHSSDIALHCGSWQHALMRHVHSAGAVPQGDWQSRRGRWHVFFLFRGRAEEGIF
jgi:hypothetical protein